jgi:hypothetical protein
VQPGLQTLPKPLLLLLLPLPWRCLLLLLCQRQ